MPGMAANSTIFEYIRLPEMFKIHKLDWMIPKKKETLKHYAKRICKKINEPDPIFGKLPVNATFAVPLLSKYCE